MIVRPLRRSATLAHRLFLRPVAWSPTLGAWPPRSSTTLALSALCRSVGRPAAWRVQCPPALGVARLCSRCLLHLSVCHGRNLVSTQVEGSPGCQAHMVQQPRQHLGPREFRMFYFFSSHLFIHPCINAFIHSYIRNSIHPSSHSDIFLVSYMRIYICID